MATVLLDLHNRNHGRDFCGKQPRGEAHPLDGVSDMQFVLQEASQHAPNFAGLALSGNIPNEMRFAPDPDSTVARFVIHSGLMFRESPVPYRMRVVAVTVHDRDANALEVWLKKPFVWTPTAIATLTNVFVGSYENDHPPMSYHWEPNACTSMTTFVFLHVNFQDRPGLREAPSTWRRINGAQVRKGGIHCSSSKTLGGFADVWPLFDISQN